MPAPRSLTLAATAFAALAGCRAASGPKLTLRYHPPAGAAYHYALEQHNTMRFEGGPMGAMPEHSVDANAVTAIRCTRSIVAGSRGAGITSRAPLSSRYFAS